MEQWARFREAAGNYAKLATRGAAAATKALEITMAHLLHVHQVGYKGRRLINEDQYAEEGSWDGQGAWEKTLLEWQLDLLRTAGFDCTWEIPGESEHDSVKWAAGPRQTSQEWRCLGLAIELYGQEEAASQSEEEEVGFLNRKILGIKPVYWLLMVPSHWHNRNVINNVQHRLLCETADLVLLNAIKEEGARPSEELDLLKRLSYCSPKLFCTQGGSSAGGARLCEVKYEVRKKNLKEAGRLTEKKDFYWRRLKMPETGRGGPGHLWRQEAQGYFVKQIEKRRPRKRTPKGKVQIRQEKRNRKRGFRYGDDVNPEDKEGQPKK